MEEKDFVEPDLGFINELMKSGGDSLKKCFQCATCSVACRLSSDRHPFPRKEMFYASWGLKQRLIGNPDIWLCHNCGDCSSLCPRGARPGDTLGAVRRLSVKAYSKPAVFNRLLDDPQMIPLLILIPAIVILAVGFSTGWLNLRPDSGPIVYAHFFPVALIESIFIPLSIWVGIVFYLGVKQMLADMHADYSQRGLTNGGALQMVAFLRALITTLPMIVRHDNFSTCEQTSDRKRSHMLVSFSFVGLASVAGAFVFALYILNSHGPYSQWNPVKIIANLSGVALVIGTLKLIGDRASSDNGRSTYFDWYLLGLALALGVSGMLTQLVRLADWPAAAVATYFIHLILAFNLIAFLPYSKLAHFVYRTVALTYSAYATRGRQTKW